MKKTFLLRVLSCLCAGLALLLIWGKASTVMLSYDRGVGYTLTAGQSRYDHSSITLKLVLGDRSDDRVYGPLSTMLGFGGGYARDRWVPGLVIPARHQPAIFYVLIPWWLLPPIFVFMAVWLEGTRVSITEDQQRRCQTCGYDLRAHMPGQKCPNCGQIVP